MRGLVTRMNKERLLNTTPKRHPQLTEVVPSCFQGELTWYARERLLDVITARVSRKRPCPIELLTLPTEAFAQWFVRRRG